MDRNMGLLYQERIFSLLDNSDYQEAQALLTQAWEYSQDLSGLYMAEAEIQKQSLRYGDALTSIKKAMDMNDWSGVQPIEAAKLYGELSLDVLDPIPFISYYENLPSHIQLNEYMLLYYCQALNMVNRDETAYQYAQRGLSLYPQQWRFFEIVLPQGQADDLGHFNSLWGDDPQVVEQVFYPLSFQGNSQLIDYYSSRSDSPRATAMGHPPWDVTALSSFLYNHDEIRDLDLLMDIYSQSDSSVKDLLLDYMEQQGGHYFWDGQGDGIPQGTLSLQRVGWYFSLDKKQDGISDGEIWIDAQGMVTKLEQRDEHGILTFYYDSQLHIQRAQWENDQHLWEYFIPWGKLDSSMPFNRNLFDNLRIFFTQKELISQESLYRSSSKIDQFDSTGLLFRRYFMQDNHCYLIREDSDLNGIPDRLLLVDQWQAVAGLRDVNEDGTMDLYEYFHQGQWQGLLLDHQGDGRSDYMESWGAVEIKIWDFNQDGFLDKAFIKEPQRSILIAEDMDSIDIQDTFFRDINYEEFLFNR
jgi:tetratricopeptide (TPR) repeat protein